MSGVTRKWTGWVEEKFYFEVEVEATDREDARRRMLEAPRPTKIEPGQHFRYIHRFVAHGEPWLRFAGWYDLHGPGDVVLCQCAYGHTFTAKDIALLRERLTRLGLRVAEHWNGVGCDTVSFRCEKRRGTKQFTEKQLAALYAPRKTKAAR